MGYQKIQPKAVVALRKESVDRNEQSHNSFSRKCVSLSARRAWIEMCEMSFASAWAMSVALRKESVDRNQHGGAGRGVQLPSLSARRAWIEIVVATLLRWLPQRRSPQGERG